MKNIKHPKILLNSSSPEERRGFFKKFASIVASVSAIGGFANLRAENTFSGKELSAYISIDPYIGSIGLFAGNFSIRTFALCYGQRISISENGALFSLIGTIYGGDGRVTMRLPDFRGRVPVGMGEGPGLSNKVIGRFGGQNSVTLNILELPKHSHNTSYVDPDYKLYGGTGYSSDTPFNSVLGVPALGTEIYSGNTANKKMSDTSIYASQGNLVLGTSGSSNSHDNVQPSLVLNYLIALDGKYPPRN